MPQQGGMHQGGLPPQGQFPQQPMQQQPMPQVGYPQQAHPQGMPGGPAAPGRMPGQPARHQQLPDPQAAPAGPGPDGIDWEAEAAALDNPVEADGYAEDEYVDEAAAYAEGEYAEDEYVDGEFAEDGEERSSFLGERDDSDEAAAERKAKGKKTGRRNGGACLLVALVLLGGLGGAGWWGYGFYQSNFGPPPDYTGSGSGKVNVQIQDGATASDMGKALMDAGVVKSVGAFTAAYTRAGKMLQPGYYIMASQMSGDAAVAEMISEAGGDALIIPEGKTAAEIYKLIDKKLKLSDGTTAAAAKANINNFGLPQYANGNIEGFLWPTKYSVSQGMKPEDLLKQMVTNAVNEYNQLGLDAGAQQIGLKNAYEVLTEASILQAEGNNTADFGKMARAMYNRLTTSVTNHTLGLDTTLQYSVGSKQLTDAQIHDGSNKYNTYINPGLPPTPISNPGEDALKAVLSPTPGNWVYWIAMSSTDTRFSDNKADFANNVKQYCAQNNMAFDAASTTCKSK
jgi:UPF0755 protein